MQDKRKQIRLHNLQFHGALVDLTFMAKVVMAFGTFDFIHLGHVELFKQAKKLGDKLIVVIARDSNVKRIKGKKPFFSQEERLQLVNSLKSVDLAVLGNDKDFFTAVRKYKPAIVVLGYDQNVLFESYIRKKLDEIGLKKTKVVRLKPFKHSKHKSKKLKKFYGLQN